MAITISPSMQLPIPGVGTEAGPQYATDINNCLTIVDQHDHSPGYGVQITPSGLDINADLSMGVNNLTDARTIRFQSQSAPLSGPSDLGCIYESGLDLYYNDGVGNQVRITQNGGVAGSPGSIANLTPPASASYVSASDTFVWESDVNTPANLDAGFIILRNNVANSNGLTLQPPLAMSADYALTLPPLPAAKAIVTLDASGNILADTPLSSLLPAGVILPYGGTSVPTAFLACDGTSYLRADYPTLFTAIGTAYGAADGTHFNVPDFRGRFLRGVDGSAGRDPDASSRTAMNTGGNTGNNIGSVEADAFQGHFHQYKLPTGAASNNGTYVQTTGAPNEGVMSGHSGIGAPFEVLGPRTDGTNGVPRTSSETRPINAYCAFIIKT